MTEDEKRADGKLFWPGSKELKSQKLKAHILSQKYSSLSEDETEEREKILSDLLAYIGEDSFIQGPVFFHYGIHTFIGKRCFINYDFTVQDDAEVHIGDDCNIGPKVTIVTPLHPMLASERNSVINDDGQLRHMCYAKSVIIGNCCWICAGVIICSGVTVGNNCVIGAGSVVTRDIPDGSFAAGNPCRVIRSIEKSETILSKPDICGNCKIQ